jgi:hypothetical protein
MQSDADIDHRLYDISAWHGGFGRLGYLLRERRKRGESDDAESEGEFFHLLSPFN